MGGEAKDMRKEEEEEKERGTKREGRWGLYSSSSGLKIKYLLKKMLKNNDSSVLSKDIFYCGTQNQVKWVKNKLVEKGINEDSIIIKNIKDKICMNDYVY